MAGLKRKKKQSCPSSVALVTSVTVLSYIQDGEFYVLVFETVMLVRRPMACPSQSCIFESKLSLSRHVNFPAYVSRKYYDSDMVRKLQEEIHHL